MTKLEYVFLIIKNPSRISNAGNVERKVYYRSISCCLSCADGVWIHRAFQKMTGIFVINKILEV